MSTYRQPGGGALTAPAVVMGEGHRVIDHSQHSWLLPRRQQVTEALKPDTDAGVDGAAAATTTSNFHSAPERAQRGGASVSRRGPPARGGARASGRGHPPLWGWSQCEWAWLSTSVAEPV